MPQPGDSDPVPHGEAVAGLGADLHDLADHLVAGNNRGAMYG